MVDINRSMYEKNGVEAIFDSDGLTLLIEKTYRRRTRS